MPKLAAPYGGPAAIRYEVGCSLDGASYGPLVGHVLLLTGKFSGGKSEVSRKASRLGCAVKENWSKKVTLLVTGERDPSEFNGEEKSEKHRQAEEAQRGGQDVAILTEQQFMDWLAGLERQQQTA